MKGKLRLKVWCDRCRAYKWGIFGWNAERGEFRCNIHRHVTLFTAMRDYRLELWEKLRKAA